MTPCPNTSNEMNWNGKRIMVNSDLWKPKKKLSMKKDNGRSDEAGCNSVAITNHIKNLVNGNSNLKEKKKLHLKTTIKIIPKKNTKNSIKISQEKIHTGPAGVERVSSAETGILTRRKMAKIVIKQTVGSHYISDEVIEHNCGLSNIGNTCFVNSCVQLIYHINFRNLPTSANNTRLEQGTWGTSGDRDVSDALRNLLALMQTADNVKPRGFLRVIGNKFPQFSDGEEHDAHEFLMALLNTLQEENIDNNSSVNESLHIESDDAQSFLKKNLSMNNTRWYKDFLILEQHSVSCTQCSSSSTWFQTSCCLSIKVPNKMTSLEKIFSQITDDTTVSSCQSCTGPQQKEIRRKIILASKYIVIHLDRFRFSNGMPRKNKTLVHPTPVKMNINNKILQYRVAGVIAHYGTISTGHYTYCHNNKTHWIEISDSRISKRPPPNNGYIVLLELESNLG